MIENKGKIMEECPYCGKEAEIELTCPECGREGCEHCMPSGKGCVCPECEEKEDEANQ